MLRKRYVDARFESSTPTASAARAKSGDASSIFCFGSCAPPVATSALPSLQRTESSGASFAAKLVFIAFAAYAVCITMFGPQLFCAEESGAADALLVAPTEPTMAAVAFAAADASSAAPPRELVANCFARAATVDEQMRCIEQLRGAMKAMRARILARWEHHLEMFNDTFPYDLPTTGLARRLLESMVANRTLRVAALGSSVTKGENNMFNQTYMYQLEIFANQLWRESGNDVGVRGDNLGASGHGGTTSVQQSIPTLTTADAPPVLLAYDTQYCIRNRAGDDVDVLFWEYGMFGQSGVAFMELWLRQALMLPSQPVVQFLFIGGGRKRAGWQNLTKLELPIAFRWAHRPPTALQNYYNGYPTQHVSTVETMRGWWTVDYLECCNAEKNWVNWHPGPGGHLGTAQQLLWVWMDALETELSEWQRRAAGGASAAELRRLYTPLDNAGDRHVHDVEYNEVRPRPLPPPMYCDATGCVAPAQCRTQEQPRHGPSLWSLVKGGAAAATTMENEDDMLRRTVTPPPPADNDDAPSPGAWFTRMREGARCGNALHNLAIQKADGTRDRSWCVSSFPGGGWLEFELDTRLQPAPPMQWPAPPALLERAAAATVIVVCYNTPCWHYMCCGNYTEVLEAELDGERVKLTRTDPRLMEGSPEACWVVSRAAPRKASLSVKFRVPKSALEMDANAQVNFGWLQWW